MSTLIVVSFRHISAVLISYCFLLNVFVMSISGYGCCANLLFGPIFMANCMKMKELNRVQGGARSCPPLGNTND